MLRIHFPQCWVNLADLACEEALYDSASLCRFVGIGVGCERVPDATIVAEVSQTAFCLVLFCRISSEWLFCFVI